MTRMSTVISGKRSVGFSSAIGMNMTPPFHTLGLSGGKGKEEPPRRRPETIRDRPCYTGVLMPERPGPPSPSPVSVGDVLLKRYRIVELLAEGGHSFVYRAQDERLRRPACVKLLRRSAIDPLFRRTIEQRFVQEAFLLARLAHPSILRVYDFGYLPGAQVENDGELPFQVCEMISGGPLSRWVKRRIRLDPQEVVALVLPLARALAEVHGAGLVHLDVKPQNILPVKTPSGREPKLADFGIAQAIPSGLPEGTSSVLLYSVNWAAPEQMVGDPVSGACDVYSLALV